MKFLTKLFLHYYLSRCSLDKNQFDVDSLLKEYFKREIKSLDDVRNSGFEFFTFIKNHENKILRKTASSFDFYKEAKHLAQGVDFATNPKFIKHNRLFVNLTKEFMSSKNTKLLDVGAGVIPFSSILFAKEYEYVSAMDKFALTIEFLESLDVHGIEEYFTSNTDISNYDLIVGRNPCSAIPHIVENCAKNNKPYIIELCECELPDINPFTGKSVKGWDEILPYVDNKIRFYNDFAYNIDATDSQATKIFDKYEINQFEPIFLDSFTRFVISLIRKCEELEQLHSIGLIN